MTGAKNVIIIRCYLQESGKTLKYRRPLDIVTPKDFLSDLNQLHVIIEH